MLGSGLRTGLARPGRRQAPACWVAIGFYCRCTAGVAPADPRIINIEEHSRRRRKKLGYIAHTRGEHTILPEFGVPPLSYT